MSPAASTATLHAPIATHRSKPAVAESTLVTSSVGRRSLAVLRLATGFIFLWAFIDKTFGLGYSTATAAA